MCFARPLQPEMRPDEAALAAKALHGVAAIVLAGGQGTRLFPLTQTRCKPAVAFGGRYLLIDIPLSNALNSGIENIFVISQYLASSLQEYIVQTYTTQKIPIRLICPQETAEKKLWFEGTADAVRKNLEHLKHVPADYFLILSGDQLYNIDFQHMLSFAISKNADLVIASLPVSKENAKRMGVMRVDEEKCIRRFVEKPTQPELLKDIYDIETQTCLGSMGIYIFKKSALIEAMAEHGNDFGSHIIPSTVAKGGSYAFVYDGYWVDIGTIGSYYEANLALTQGGSCLDIYDESHPIYGRHNHLPSPMIKNTLVRDSLISQGSIIEAEEIASSVIGVRARIGQGSIVHRSIVLGNHLHDISSASDFFGIGEDCVIDKAIIDEQSYIGHRARLTNSKNIQNFDGDGIYIRDGIIIVTSGARIPDGFIL